MLKLVSFLVFCLGGMFAPAVWAGGDPMKLYELRNDWLRRELPEMYSALLARFEYVEQHRTFVHAELLSTRDFNNALKPLLASCTQGKWQPLSIANFREEDQQVLISDELWSSANLPTLDKARKVTGLLFAALP